MNGHSTLSTYTRGQHGFTLIEISIVLVIIGLLIGGILAAQSMIETAKIQAEIRQLQQIDIVTQDFITKYNRLPGDRNANGWIASSNSAQPSIPCAPSIDNECQNIFAELSSMEGFPGNYSYTSPDSLRFGPGRQFPYDKLGRSGVYGVQNVRKDLFWIIAVDKASTSSDMSGSTIDALTPSEALALDSKLDDGNAFTGNTAVVAGDGRGPSSCTLGQYFCGNSVVANPDDYALTSAGSSSCANQSTGVYQVANSTPTCGLQIKAQITIP